jgi:hypothetical protein
MQRLVIKNAVNFSPIAAACITFKNSGFNTSV